MTAMTILAYLAAMARAAIWAQKHPWFRDEVIPALRREVAEALAAH
jgi:hypothetical protein